MFIFAYMYVNINLLRVPVHVQEMYMGIYRNMYMEKYTNIYMYINIKAGMNIL